MTLRAPLAALALAALALAAGPAAACPAVIAGADWDDGTRLAVTSRASDVVMLDAEIPLAGGEGFPVRFRMQAGLIPLWNSGADGPLGYDWTTPLPGPADLRPGAAFDLAGHLHAWGEVQPLTLRISVLGVEEVTVAGCTYETTLIETQVTESAHPAAPVLTWLHLPSLLPLRESSETAETPWRREAVALR